MSNLEKSAKIKEISEALKEPEWLLGWREKQMVNAKTLPKAIKHGIAITALFPETEPDYSSTAEYHVDASKGLEIYTWREAVTQEEVEPILRGLLESDFFPHPTDYFRACGLAHFQSGLVIYVQPNMAPDGTFVKETLALDTIVSTNSSADVVVVIMKEGAQLELSSRMSGGNAGSVHARTFVVIAESETRVRITQESALSVGAMALCTSRAIVASHGEVTWREIAAGDMLLSSLTHNLLIGEGALVRVLQGFAGTLHAEFDIDVRATHVADETTSTISTRGTAEGAGKILYRGLVDMRPGVRGVRGAQEAKFLALSKGAKIDAIPSLDIATNDVTSSHKLSIAHVREGDTFYPRLRGLSDRESRALFLESHFGEVFRGDDGAKLRETLCGD